MKTVLINQSSIPMPRHYIFAALETVLKMLKSAGHKSDLSRKELVIVFVDRKRAKELNAQFRNKNYSTDVLSFSGEDELLGELVLCAPVVKKQAKDHQLSFRDESIYLIIHGILHLLGYDHEGDKSEARQMYDLQDKIFDKCLNR